MEYIKVFFRTVKEYLAAMVAYALMLGVSWFIFMMCYEVWRDFLTK